MPPSLHVISILPSMVVYLSCTCQCSPASLPAVSILPPNPSQHPPAGPRKCSLISYLFNSSVSFVLFPSSLQEQAWNHPEIVNLIICVFTFNRSFSSNCYCCETLQKQHCNYITEGWSVTLRDFSASVRCEWWLCPCSFSVAWSAL